MTYYTCDTCDWAGPFSDAKAHFDESGHTSFSKREPVKPPALPYTTTPLPPKCNHSFTWMGTIPPTHCPVCGMYLGPIGWPYVTTTPNTFSTSNTSASFRLINGGEEEPPASVVG